MKTVSLILWAVPLLVTQALTGNAHGALSEAPTSLLLETGLTGDSAKIRNFLTPGASCWPRGVFRPHAAALRYCARVECSWVLLGGGGGGMRSCYSSGDPERRPLAWWKAASTGPSMLQLFIPGPLYGETPRLHQSAQFVLQPDVDGEREGAGREAWGLRTEGSQLRELN